MMQLVAKVILEKEKKNSIQVRVKVRQTMLKLCKLNPDRAQGKVLKAIEHHSRQFYQENISKSRKVMKSKSGLQCEYELEMYQF